MRIYLYVCLLLVFVPLASAGAEITLLDISNNSDTEILFFNSSGNLEISLLSNGSSYTFPSGGYVALVLPADQGYNIGNPMHFWDGLLYPALQLLGKFVLVIGFVAALAIIFKGIVVVRL